MQDAMKSYEETMKVNENKINHELEDVFVKIHESINNGVFNVFGDGELNDFTVYKLQKLGYDVKNHVDGRDFYFISWSSCDVFQRDKLSFNGNIQNQFAYNSNTNTRNKSNKRKFPIFWR